ncbi:MAG TPA: hypothetical protein VG205_00695 [Acidimicrobiales bacterium]|nr:hypothetical protein [Acidimicrobiales bacterium]
MPVVTHRSFATRAPRSEIDRRAVGVAGHLLMAGIWLERRLKNSLSLRPNQPRNEET